MGCEGRPAEDCGSHEGQDVEGVVIGSCGRGASPLGTESHWLLASDLLWDGRWSRDSGRRDPVDRVRAEHDQVAHCEGDEASAE